MRLPKNIHNYLVHNDSLNDIDSEHKEKFKSISEMLDMKPIRDKKPAKKTFINLEKSLNDLKKQTKS
jgi:hypothetical protein